MKIKELFTETRIHYSRKFATQYNYFPVLRKLQPLFVSVRLAALAPLISLIPPVLAASRAGDSQLNSHQCQSH